MPHSPAITEWKFACNLLLKSKLSRFKAAPVMLPLSIAYMPILKQETLAITIINNN